MRRITLSFDEDLLEKVRTIAARRKTKVSTIIRDHLNSLAASQVSQDEKRNPTKPNED